MITELAELFEHCSTTLPPSEAATCSWVIEPLLKLAGYAHYDILPQERAPSGDRPDYKLLHRDLDANWYLEAKGWGRPLTQEFAYQCVGYAAVEGHKWVVLSSGDRWQVFDLRLGGAAPQKLAVDVRLSDFEDMAALLRAISPQSVRDGKIFDFLSAEVAKKHAAERSSRARRVLDAELLVHPGKLFSVVLNELRKVPELSELSFEELGSALGQKPSGPPVVNELSPSLQEETGKLVGLRMDQRHTKAVRLFLPGELPRPVVLWKDVLSEVIAWLANRNALPSLPFTPGKPGTRVLLSQDPAGMTEPRAVNVDGSVIWAETHFSANDLCKNAARLLELAGIDPQTVSIERKNT